MNLASKYNFIIYILEIRSFIGSSFVKILLGIDTDQCEFCTVFDNKIIALNVPSPTADNQKCLRYSSVAVCSNNLQKQKERQKLTRISICTNT